MSNEIRFRIFEILATHDDDYLSVNHVMSIFNRYDTFDILREILDMVEDKQIRYFSAHTKTNICPTDI